MRDLEADLDEFNHWMCDNYDTYDPALMWFSLVLPHAIGRAIKAEAEVERLLGLLETHHSKCVVCEPVSEIAHLEADVRVLRDIGKVTKDLISPLIINENETLKSELARYKRALELASLYIDKELDQCPVPLPNHCHDNCLDCMPQYFLRQALVELDKEGTVER